MFRDSVFICLSESDTKRVKISIDRGHSTIITWGDRYANVSIRLLWLHAQQDMSASNLKAQEKFNSTTGDLIQSIHSSECKPELENGCS